MDFSGGDWLLNTTLTHEAPKALQGGTGLILTEPLAMKLDPPS